MTQEPNDKTLRDEFAMAALSGMMARSTWYDEPWSAAKIAYEYADAMMEARKK